MGKNNAEFDEDPPSATCCKDRDSCPEVLNPLYTCSSAYDDNLL